jgi:hypothetical protein
VDGEAKLVQEIDDVGLERGDQRIVARHPLDENLH